MSRPLKGLERSTEILRLLEQHGPLGVRALSEMVHPPMQDPRIHEVLTKLINLNVVQKRFNTSIAQRAFYQIRQTLPGRVQASQILSCAPEDLLQHQFRYRELFHAESCALWLHRLKHLFPESAMIRDFEFPSNNFARDIMLNRSNDREATPDILMTFPKAASGRQVTIAIEVERTWKSAERLRLKLRKYANGTLVDGVIYICEEDGLDETISQICDIKVLRQAERIKHYGRFYFMFLNTAKPVRQEAINLSTCDFKYVPVHQWITFLRSTPMNMRRNEHFNNQEPPTD